MPFRILTTEARTILSRTSGFIAEAGFTHSLTPARNCTFGCTYCYVPTMRLQGGLQPDDWRRWGQFTTLKQNAAALLRRELRGHERIYCSPLVDPYQPAEAEAQLIPEILAVLIERRPAVFCLQTRGPLVLRDVELLRALAAKTHLTVSFSLTTDREEVRQRYEPHCAPVAERLRVIRTLRAAGLAVHATLAPLLPCNPERLAQLALEATGRDLIGDPLHVRATKARGATTHEPARKIAAVHGEEQWFEPEFQVEIVARIAAVAEQAGRRFLVGPQGFGLLAAGTALCQPVPQ